MKNIYKIGIIFILALIILSSFFAIFVHHDLNIDVVTDGEHVKVNTQTSLFRNNEEMNNAMNKYVSHQIKEVDSDIPSIKNGLTEIANSYNYNVKQIHFYTPYGEDVLPMPVVVKGTSMAHTLEDGDKGIIVKTKDIKVGDIVVSKHPQYKLIIKRIHEIKGDKVYLMSDNRQVIVKDGYIYKGLDTWVNRGDIIGVLKKIK